MSSVTLEVVVHGQVQGVGFRYFVRNEALDLGLTGWVANEPDGSVRCVASGPRAALEAFADRLREGPPAASVDRVDLAWRPGAPEAGGTFTVRPRAHTGD